MYGSIYVCVCVYTYPYPRIDANVEAKECISAYMLTDVARLLLSPFSSLPPPLSLFSVPLVLPSCYCCEGATRCDVI